MDINGYSTVVIRVKCITKHLTKIISMLPGIVSAQYIPLPIMLIFVKERVILFVFCPCKDCKLN